MRRNIARAVAPVAVVLAALVLVIAPPAGIPTAQAATAPTITGTPPPGTVGQPYNFAFTVTGDPAPTVARIPFGGGTLPPGLTLSTAGVLSGTPTTGGTFTFTIRASSSSGNSPNLPVTLTILAPPTIAGDPPDGNVGKSYSYTFTRGGSPTPTVTATGDVPPGLTLSSTGVLSGTPTATGTFTFNAVAASGTPPPAILPVTLVINAALTPPTITGTPPRVTVNTPYNFAYTLGGNPTPTVALGLFQSLPPGLTLSPSGVISGTPTAVGTTNFTLNATNGNSPQASISSTIVVDPVASAATITGAPPSGNVGKSYNFAFTVGGFPAPTVTSTGILPPGLTLSASGVLSGTPTTTGTFTFDAVATNAGGSATLPVTLIINPALTPPTITGAPPRGIVGTPYNHVFTLGGYPTPTVALVQFSGSLPAGLTLSPEGVLSGTPTTAGTSNFSVRATNGTNPAATLAVTLVIDSSDLAPTITGTPPSGNVGKSYNFAFTVGGSPAPAVTSTGTLPPGLTLSASGVLSGTPTTVGWSTFDVVATNSVGTSETLSVTVIINTALTPPTITGTPPKGTVGEPYTFTFTLGGNPTPTVALAPLSFLPAGLTLSPQGVLSGTPTDDGTSTFTVRATNGTNPAANLPVTLVIDPVGTPPTITGTPPKGTVGQGYNYAFILGGDPTPTVALVPFSGSLPAGLTLSAAGVISGTPTTAGTSNFSVRATNSAGTSANLPVTLVVDPAASAATITGTPPSGNVGKSYNFAFTVGGFPAPTVTSTGDLPAGLTLSASGVLSGTPTTTGTSTFSVVATNGVGTPATLPVTILINPALTPPTITGTPPKGTVGEPYNFAFTLGGYPTPTVTLNFLNFLPAGLTLSPTGVISGTPTTAGTSTFTVTASNGTNPTATLTSTLVIDPAASAATITGTPPKGTVGQAYNFAFTLGGEPTPTVALVPLSGSLPAGLTLSTDGVISGTPTTAGTSNFSVRATNSAGTSANLPVTLVIDPAAAAATITGTPPSGTTGQSYNYQFTVGGFPTPTVTSTGDVPPGLTLSNTGRLSGTPNTAGTFTFDAVATNSGGSATLPVTVTINTATTPPTITGTPPSGTVGQPYTYQFTLGGNPLPTVSTSLGSVPPGLTLTPTGLLSGTPTTAGSSTFTITASNGYIIPATLRPTITINPVNAPPTITGTPPNGTMGQSYNYQFTLGGFPTPTVTSTGDVPPGLTLSSAGRLSGTPTAAGTFTFNAVAVNGVSPGATLPVTITIATATTAPTITGTPPSGTVGQPYTYQFTLGGNPLPTVSTSLGSVPPGLTLSPTGLLSGTPTTAGSSTFTITASNGYIIPATLRPTITINPGNSAPTITGTPPNGTTGQSYNYQFTLGGFPTPTVTATGNVPPGLTLSETGRLSGTPTTGGTFTFNAVAVNGVSPAATLPVTITIAVADYPATITGTPPNAQVFRSYNFAFTVGGIPAPTVTVSFGSLPLGMSLSESGVLSGLPLAAGTSIFTVSATNGLGILPATLLVTFVVDPGNSAPTISGTPNNGTVNLPYSYQFELGGFPAPTTTVTSGNLPPGLTLSETGRLSGTPSEAGTFDFTVRATNGVGRDATFPTSVLILSTFTFPPTVSGSPPSGNVNQPYSHTFTLTGNPPPTASVTSGSLPPGLTLTPAGVLAGTPTKAGSFTYTVSANNGNAVPGTLLVIQAINGPPIISGTPPRGTIDVSYDYQFEVSGYPTPTVRSTGVLPPGLTLLPNGRLFGTPTELGTFSFAVVASNLTGTADTLQVDLTIGEPCSGSSCPGFFNFNFPGTGSAGPGSGGTPAEQQVTPAEQQVAPAEGIPLQPPPPLLDTVGDWLRQLRLGPEPR